MDEATGLKIMPHWLAQPYFRPPPPVGECLCFAHLSVLSRYSCISLIISSHRILAQPKAQPEKSVPAKRPLSVAEDMGKEDSKKVRLEEEVNGGIGIPEVLSVS